MLTSLSIENFRCFKNLSIESLERVNLIAGKNNVGKTALLEAFFLLSNGQNSTGIATISNNRRIEKISQSGGSELIFNSLFHNFNNDRKINISGLLTDQVKHTIEIKAIASNIIERALGYKSNLKLIEEIDNQNLLGFNLHIIYTNSLGESRTSRSWIEEENLRGEMTSKQSPLPVNFILASMRQSAEQIAESFGRLEIYNRQYNLLESLKVLEPRLKRLATVFIAGTPIIHGDIGLDRLLPLSVMGEGLGRFISILLAIANTPKGVVLIDEIENGLHHSVLHKIWYAVADAARRFDTQIIATTHSYECIQAAHQAFSQEKNSNNSINFHHQDYDFQLHRLERSGEVIRVITYDQETLDAALKAELEVR